ncbi:MAG: ABC transporter ATP-binding protein [Elusimicrobia bacterium]|nr:ABC transporter ATP-binding protein [Elusimicrobiota bacterium]
MSSPRAKLRFRAVAMRYDDGGRAVQALDGAELEVREREFICLLGPSGCGKSTLLHLAAGFLRPTAGSVLVDGREVSGPGTDRGMVFQQHNLFPWQTVSGNVGFGPRLKGRIGAELDGSVALALEEVGLADFSEHYPPELSIGMQQRVGLARAFANDPDILLLDEPFASLDALTRLQMQRLLLSLWQRRRQTVIFVTHDVEEALLLADRLVLLSPRPGRVTRDISVPLGPREGRPRDRRLPELKEDILSQLLS